MDSFFSRYRNGLILGLVLLAQVIGLAIQVRRPVPGAGDGRTVRLLRYWMITVIGPPEKVAHTTGLSLRGIWFNYIGLRHARQRSRELQAEVDRLRLEQAGLAEDARQGHRLQQLLNFKEKYIYQTLPAQVIGTSGTDMSRILIIDKGAKDGVRVEMPVITPDGIVGKVREVFPHASQILQISDQSSGAGVMLETTRIRGVLRGNAYGQPQIINIMPDERIKPGDRVLTSGGDQVFPRGMTVGYVDKVVTDPDRSPYVDVVIRPAASLSQLEEVLVITSTGDAMPVAEAKDVAQSEADAASRHSAADVLSDKLPGLKDPNDPNAYAAQEAAEEKTAEGDVARPVRPPPAQHADRFTPGTTPDADTLTPAQAMPHPPHVQPPPAPQTGAVASEKKPAPPAASHQAAAVKTSAASASQTPKTPAAGTSNPVTAKTPAATGQTATAKTPAANSSSPVKHPATGNGAAASGAGAEAAAKQTAASRPVSGSATPQTSAGKPPSAPGEHSVATTRSVTREQIPGDGVHVIVNDGPDPKRRKISDKPPAAAGDTAPVPAARQKPAPAQQPPAPAAPPQGGN